MQLLDSNDMNLVKSSLEIKHYRVLRQLSILHVE